MDYEFIPGGMSALAHTTPSRGAWSCTKCGADLVFSQVGRGLCATCEAHAACEATEARVSRLTMTELLAEIGIIHPTRDTYLYVDLAGKLIATELPRHWRAAPSDEYMSLGYATQTVGCR